MQVAAEPTAADLIAAWRTNPVAFSRTVLRSDPWAGTARVMMALAEPHARVAVRGAHAMGKTRMAAEIVLWWVATGGVAITTAARFAQVRQGIWARMGELLAQARIPLGVMPNQTELRLGPGAEAFGWSTNNETRFQGIHAERLLFVVDEAPGVAPGIFRAISGSRAGGDVRELQMGNPSVPAGPFYEASRSASWKAFRLDAFDSPNLRRCAFEEAGVVGPQRKIDLRRMTPEQLDRAERPYLATRRWVLEQAEQFGVTSPYWTWKVRGEFPQQSEDALCLLEWLEAAREPAPLAGSEDNVEVGIDVAGPGEDEHVIAARQGADVLFVEAIQSTDPDVIAGRTISRIRAMPVPPRVVKVDSIGIGTYFVTILQDAGIYAIPLNVATKCSTEENRRRFANQKAEHYWNLRERLRAGNMHGLEDEKARAQLASIRWREPGGRVEIESKDAMRARGLRSPDRAEALMLAFAETGEFDAIMGVG